MDVRLAATGLSLLLLLVGGACSVERSGLRRDEDDGGPSPDGETSDGGGLDGARDATPPPDARMDGRPADTGRPDAEPPDGAADAGPPVLDFYDVGWDAPARIDDSGGPDDCSGADSKDPVLSADRRWLVLSRFESDCSTRRFQLFEWNDGAPGFVDTIGPIHPDDTEHNPHLLDGEHVGRPGELLLVYTANVGGGDRDLWSVGLSDDPPLTLGTPENIDGLSSAGDDSDPSLTRTGDRLLFAREGDVREATGEPPAGYAGSSAVDAVNTGDGEVDPAVSPDGRVLVFVRTGSDPDLWVARRRDSSSSFEPPERLAKGTGEINTSDGEWDPFIATDGDLLFVRDGEVYAAPARFP